MFRQKNIMISGILGILLLSTFMPLLTSNAGTTKTPSPIDNYSPLSSSTSYTNVSIFKLERDVVVNEHGLVIIEDNFKILNNHSSTKMTIDICIADDEIDSLIFYEAYDLTGGPMNMHLLSEKQNGYSILSVVMSEPLLPYSEIEFNMKTVMKYSKLKFNLYTDNAEATLYLMPITPYPLTAFNTTVNLPEGSNGVQGHPNTYFAGEEMGADFNYYGGINIAPYEEISNTFQYLCKLAGPNIITSMDRSITISPWGYIRVQEEINLVSYSFDPFYVFFIYVPFDAYDLHLYDSLGEIGDREQGYGIQTGVDNLDGTRTYEINLIYNRARLLRGSIFNFNIEYFIPYDSVTSEKYGTTNLNLDILTTKTDFLMENINTKIEIIGASSIENMNIDPDSEMPTAKSIILTIDHDNLFKDQRDYIDISYKINNLVKYSRSYILTLIVIAICSIYVISKANKKEEVGESGDMITKTIPISELSEFVTLYEEKNAIMIDMERKDADLLRKKIQKKAYNQSVKLLESKLKELNEEVEPFKKVLINSTADIRFIIQKLDYLEAEKGSVKDGVRLLKERYKKGKLPSKAAYERLLDDMLKRTSTAQKKIDRYINELRAFAI